MPGKLTGFDKEEVLKNTFCKKYFLYLLHRINMTYFVCTTKLTVNYITMKCKNSFIVYWIVYLSIRNVYKYGPFV